MLFSLVWINWLNIRYLQEILLHIILLQVFKSKSPLSIFIDKYSTVLNPCHKLEWFEANMPHLVSEATEIFLAEVIIF